MGDIIFKRIQKYLNNFPVCFSNCCDDFLLIVLMGHLLKAKKECKMYSRYIYQNELDKACFQQDMAYGDSIDSPRRTAVWKIFVW